MIGSCQTVPVNDSAAPRREGTEPDGLISMANVLPVSIRLGGAGA
jgi:hypothetical protein